MPRPASPRKSQPARRSAPLPVKRAAKAAPKPVKTAAKASARTRGNGPARADVKPAPREVRGSGDRRASERILHGRNAVVESPGSASRGKYVYCIIESIDPLRFGPIGVGADPSDVYTVHYKNLAAVETAVSASRGKYVYCIIESSDPLRFGPIGVGADPSDVYTVH